MSLEMLGADQTQDYGMLARGLGELAGRGIEQYQQRQAEEKASADAQAKAAAAIAADTTYANALAKAIVSDALAAAAPAGSSVQKAAAAQAAADDAAAAEAASADDDAAAAVPVNAQSRRVKAATDALAAATHTLQAKPQDPFSQALVKAWGAIVLKAQNKQIRANAPGTPESMVKDKGWPLWKKAAVGGGVAVGGVGLIALIVKLVRR